MKKNTPLYSKRLLTLLSLLFVSISWSCAPVSQHSQRQPLSQDISSQSNSPEEIEEIVLTPTIDAELQNSPEEMTPAEPEETVSIEIQELEKLGNWEEKSDSQIAETSQEVEYDFPITINKQVEYYLNFFQNKNRKSFQRWLARSGRYVPMITERLKEAGIPTDLAYLPMIESGYNLTAYSRAKAVGPWQFMRATGIGYGLKINNYVDERRDPIKSTQAAIAYLKNLYNEFNSWELAVAGYNAGEGRIRRGIKKYKTNNFWKLAQYRFLPSETKRYVPKLIAAILIAKSPEEYGFSKIQYDAPLSFEYTKVPRWTSLRAVAIALGADIKEIHNLNRELRKQITPPDEEYYNLKIPMGAKDLLAANLPRVHTTVTTKFKTHVVKKKETLNRICRKYNLNKTTMLKANNLRNAKLNPGQRLRIPYRVADYVLLTEEELKNQKAAGRNGNFILHKIKAGDTIGKLARKYNVSPQIIAAWNGLKNIHKIRVGQQLALYTDYNKQTKTKRIAKIHKPTNSKASSIPILKETNKKHVSKLPSYASTPKYYQVRGGDSLWKIARRFKLQTDDIKRWNNLKGNTIHPGLKLLIKGKTDV